MIIQRQTYDKFLRKKESNSLFFNMTNYLPCTYCSRTVLSYYFSYAGTNKATENIYTIQNDWVAVKIHKYLDYEIIILKALRMEQMFI